MVRSDLEGFFETGGGLGVALTTAVTQTSENLVELGMSRQRGTPGIPLKLAAPCNSLYDAFLRLTSSDFCGARASNSLRSAGICLCPVTLRNCFWATRSPDPTQRSRWSPPCQRFTFLQTCSTIENADSITLVLASVLRSCIGT